MTKLVSNKNLIFSILVLGIISHCQSMPQNPHPHQEPDQETSAPFYMQPLIKVIEHHKTTTTHMDGPRCPLYPTCSAWAEQAISQHGIWGLFMFIDRLFYREFGELHEHYVLVPTYKSQRMRYYDPLSDTFGGQADQDGPSLLQDDF